MDHRHVTDLHMLAADDVITVLPRSRDFTSEPWAATVRDVVLPSRESRGGSLSLCIW